MTLKSRWFKIDIVKPDIVLFFGAGASTVKPYTYPMTKGFFEIVKKKRLDEKDSKAYESLGEIAKFTGFKSRSNDPLSGMDIEVLMDVLKKIELLSSDDRYFGRALANSLQEYTSASMSYDNIEELAEKIARINSYLKHLIVNVYGGAKDSEKGSDEHLQLMINVMGIYNRYGFKKLIPIFTVNYDQVIEACLENSNYMKAGKIEIEDSFKSDTSWFPMQLRNPDPDEDRFLFQIHKLHGSIDWYKHRGKVFRMRAELELGNPDKHVLLFPGFKSIPTYEPYGHHHDMLDLALESASICIVVGFAFRDGYINEIFKKAMARRRKPRPDLILIIINPDKKALAKPPLDAFIKEYGASRVIHFPMKFCKESNQATLDKMVKILDAQSRSLDW